MKFMSRTLFIKNFNTFFLDSSRQIVYTVQAMKNFTLFIERNVIMYIAAKTWMKTHIPHIGTILLLCGVFCLTAKALSPEYLDATGYLHENFFLLPVGFGLLFAAVLLFLGAGIHFLKRRLSR